MGDAVEFKIVLIGAANVGKTCIVQRGTTGAFNSGTMPTLGASYTSKMIHVNDKLVRLLIWDTAGQERYRGITPMYYRNASAAIIVYSIVDEESFEQIDPWLRSLRDNLPTSVLLFVVGNKSDLESGRSVPVDFGQDKASAIKAHFTEVSAKTGDGIEELFVFVASTCLDATAQKAGNADGSNVAETVQVDGKKGDGGGQCC
jgi:small GTP-binding protein